VSGQMTDRSDQRVELCGFVLWSRVVLSRVSLVPFGPRSPLAKLFFSHAVHFTIVKHVAADNITSTTSYQFGCTTVYIIQYFGNA